MTNPHQPAIDRLMPIAAEFLQSDPEAARAVGKAIAELMRAGKRRRKRGLRTRLADGSEFIIDADNPLLEEAMK